MSDVTPLPKNPRIRDTKWTNSARHRPCDMCERDDQTTVFAHMRVHDYAGMSRKPNDWRGAFLCKDCHDLEGSKHGGKEAFWIAYLEKQMRERYEDWKNGL